MATEASSLSGELEQPKTKDLEIYSPQRHLKEMPGLVTLVDKPTDGHGTSSVCSINSEHEQTSRVHQRLEHNRRRANPNKQKKAEQSKETMQGRGEKKSIIIIMLRQEKILQLQNKNKML